MALPVTGSVGISRILGRRFSGHLRNDGLLQDRPPEPSAYPPAYPEPSLCGLPRNTLLGSYRLTVREILLCILLLILVRVLMFERVDDAWFQTLEANLGTQFTKRSMRSSPSVVSTTR